MYFINTKEAEDFINNSDNPKRYRLTPTTEKECGYYSFFGKIEGCEVLNIVTIDFYNVELHFCIRWNGVLMMVDLTQSSDWDKYNTFALKLVEEMDWKGISERNVNVEKYVRVTKPQKIGKPTAKKLDQWLEYLQDVRKAEITARDRQIAYMVGKIETVKQLFPETKDVKWDNSGAWWYTVKKGGLIYNIVVRRDGQVYEKLELERSCVDMTERMAKMSNNDYTPIQFESFEEEWKHLEEETEKLIAKYLGQELPDNNV